MYMLCGFGRYRCMASQLNVLTPSTASHACIDPGWYTWTPSGGALCHVGSCLDALLLPLHLAMTKQIDVALRGQRLASSLVEQRLRL